MSNIKNREYVNIHFQIDKSSAEMINNLFNLFKTEFDKPVYKYDVLDFLVYEFEKFRGDYDDTQIIYEFLKFKGIDPTGAGDTDD